MLLASIKPAAAIDDKKPLLEAGLGAACLSLPDYRGADRSRLYVLPFPYFIYRGDFLRVDEDLVSGRLFETDRVLLDVSFFGSLPVESDGNSARRGMPDLDPTFEVGPALDISLLKNYRDRYELSVNLPVRAVFSTDFSSIRHRGWSFSPRLNFEARDIIADSGIDFGLSAGPFFADDAYHDYYYTVKPAYQTASRPAYDAGGGYSGSTLSIGLKKRLNSFILHGFISMDDLSGAVFEDSPLVKTRYSFMGGFTITWIFFKSDG
ncbi:MAG: MipA/OmpV family protein [Desulfosudaceae bacterium]